MGIGLIQIRKNIFPSCSLVAGGEEHQRVAGDTGGEESDGRVMFCPKLG